MFITQLSTALPEIRYRKPASNKVGARFYMKPVSASPTDFRIGGDLIEFTWLRLGDQMVVIPIQCFTEQVYRGSIAASESKGNLAFQLTQVPHKYKYNNMQD